MNKGTQDLAWKSIPRETRDEIRKRYRESVNMGLRISLCELFGEDNITSDEEPSELLFVERKDVINFFDKYIGNPTREVNRLLLRKEIKTLFGDKCLPDKEPSVQVEPRFK